MATAFTSWKEIAKYLGKGVRTAQRWEHEAGLPIRRPMARIEAKSSHLVTSLMSGRVQPLHGTAINRNASDYSHE
jgi:hypothetical protein